MYGFLHGLRLFHPSIGRFILGGFGILDIFRNGCIGMVLNMAYERSMNSCKCVFSLKYLSSLLSYHIIPNGTYTKVQWFPCTDM